MQSADYPPYAVCSSDGNANSKREYCGCTRLKAGLICPHKGADLSTFEPDERDCVTCPLHGLTWNVRTGELVPAPLTEAEIKKERIYGTVLHN